MPSSQNGTYPHSYAACEGCSSSSSSPGPQGPALAIVFTVHIEKASNSLLSLGHLTEIVAAQLLEASPRSEDSPSPHFHALPSSYTTAAWCSKTTPRERHTVLETKWSPPVSSLVEISRQKSPGTSPQPCSFPRRDVVQQAFSEGLKPNRVISHVFHANEKGQQHLPGHHGI